MKLKKKYIFSMLVFTLTMSSMVDIARADFETSFFNSVNFYELLILEKDFPCEKFPPFFLFGNLCL